MLKPQGGMNALCGLSELLDITCELGFQVRSLILVNEVCLGELVEHLLHSGELLLGLSLLGSSTELADSCTHSLCVVAIVKTSLLLLTDSFY